MDRLACTLLWFERAIRKPEPKNFHTQLGCHFEEVAEMIQEISTTDELTRCLLNDARTSLEDLANHLKKKAGVVHIEDEDAAEFLDAICDQIVTATGVAHMSEMDILGAMTEVNRSNFSKFDERGQPIFNENQKVMKGPNYTQPSLAPFVDQPLVR